MAELRAPGFGLRPAFVLVSFPALRGKTNSAEDRKDRHVSLLGLLLVLLFFGLGFTLHALWIVAVILFVAWLIGLVLGRGESAGRDHFYRW